MRRQRRSPVDAYGKLQMSIPWDRANRCLQVSVNSRGMLQSPVRYMSLNLERRRGCGLPAAAVMDPPRSRVVPMRHDPNGDAASIASAKGFETAVYSMGERNEQPERWGLFKSQSDAMVAWFAAPMNVERSSAAMVEATLDGHARAFASFLGFARHVHRLEPTVERFLDGPLMQRYATFLRSTRGCKVTTIVKHMGQVLNVLRFMRAPTGRALLQVCMGMCSLPRGSAGCDSVL